MHTLAPLRYFALDALHPEKPPKCGLLGGIGAFCVRVAHEVEGPFPTQWVSGGVKVVAYVFLLNVVQESIRPQQK